MKIGKKLLISFTIITLFLLISAIVTTIYTLRINSQLQEITGKINPLEKNVQDMISILWKSNYIVQRYSTENDQETINSLRFEFEHINNQFIERGESVTASVNQELIEDRISSAMNKHNTFYKLAERLMENRDEDLATGVIYDESSILVQYSIAKQLERDVIDAVELLQESLEDLSAIKKEANERSNNVVKTAILVILLTALIGIATSFVIWSALTKSITKPIKSLSEATSKISTGNFDVSLETEEGGDEISDLSFTFNQMVVSLRKIIQESPRLKKFISIKSGTDKTQKYVVDAGTSYLIKDKNSTEAYEIMMDKLEENFQPLLLARQNPRLMEQRYGIQKKNIIWLSDEKEKGIISTSNINQIQKEITEFMTRNEKSVILFDRSDYVVNKYGFDNFLKFIISINDKVMTKQAILLLPIDPEIFSNQQLSLLEKELHKPQQQAVDVLLSDELIQILKFISDRSVINKPATYKDVGAKFSITAPTTQKKIEGLSHGGFVTVSKIGRNKTLKITRYGERLLANK